MKTRTRTWLAYSVATAAAGSLLKRHTPNFGWCQIYPTLQSILDLPHQKIFAETLGSVMRPSLHIEKALGHACGMGCVNAYYYAVYFLALFISIALISKPLFELANTPSPASNSPSNKSRSAARFILWSLPIYLVVFSYGSIVDALYPASAITLTAVLLDKLAPKGSLACPRFGTAALIGLVTVASFVADMSRPYAPYILLIFLAASAAQKNYRALIGLALGLLLATPYHLNQAAAIGSPLLTNYTGCNLLEVFNAPGTIRPGGMAKTPQTTIASRCSYNEQKIKGYIIHQPLSALRDFANPPRLLRSAFPAPFTPWQYKGFPGLGNAEEALQWALWLALIIFLYIPIILITAQSVPGILQLGPSAILIGAAVGLPFLITIATNGGQEAGRVGLAFILPVTFLAAILNTLQQRQSGPQSSHHDAI